VAGEDDSQAGRERTRRIVYEEVVIGAGDDEAEGAELKSEDLIDSSFLNLYVERNAKIKKAMMEGMR